MREDMTILTHSRSGTIVVNNPWMRPDEPFSFWADPEWADGLSVGDALSLYRDEGSPQVRVTAIGRPEFLSEDLDTGDPCLKMMQVAVAPEGYVGTAAAMAS